MALLRAKADVNAAQPDGATALAWAVHLGERRMAEALLDAGARVECRRRVRRDAADAGGRQRRRRARASGCSRAGRAPTRRAGTARAR